MKRRIAWAMLIVSLVGWPITALTVARQEPQIVLALSWLALAYSSIDALLIADKEDE